MGNLKYRVKPLDRKFFNAMKTSVLTKEEEKLAENWHLR